MTCLCAALLQPYAQIHADPYPGEGGRVVRSLLVIARMAGQVQIRYSRPFLVGIADLFGVIWLMRRRADPGHVTELAMSEPALSKKSKSTLGKKLPAKKNTAKVKAAVKQKSAQKG